MRAWISFFVLVLSVLLPDGKAYDDYYDDYGGRSGTKKIAGVVDLDSITFHKIVDGSHNVFVSFVEDVGGDGGGDEEGEDDDVDFPTELETLAEKYSTHKDVILARLDAMSAYEIAEKYDVKTYPTLMLFKKGEKMPEKYTGANKAGDIGAFLGGKVGYPAPVEELGEVTKRFNEDTTNREAIIKEAKETTEKLDDDKKKLGEYYVKVMEKVMEKGDNHVTNEAKRLNSIIEKGAVLDVKLTELKQKLDILRSFQNEEL